MSFGPIRPDTNIQRRFGETIKQLRVLILEDSPLDAELMSESLRLGGLECEFDYVQAHAEFVAAVSSVQYDIILSDYSLPGFDGMAALGIARDMCPDTPFLFVSGYLGEDLAIETLKQGATDYVLKERLDKLAPSVIRALRESKQRNEQKRIEASMQLLSDASLTLSSLDYGTTLTRVARLAVPHFADICVVDIVGEEGKIERVAVADADNSRGDLAQGLLNYAPQQDSEHPGRTVMSDGQSQLLPELPSDFLENNAQDARHLEILRELGIQSCMVVPLRTDGQTLGTMTFLSTSPDHRYETLDVTLAEDLARRCALAVENARLHRRTVEALRARDEFLAVLSHELRSPLTSILGWVQILQDDNLEKETLAQGLGVIERNTRVQVQLIQELLEVSRIITGRLRLEMVPVLISQVLSNVIELIVPTAQAKGVRVEFINEADPSLILGDEPRLQQVFWNLVSNALKFTPKDGKVEVKLEATADFAVVSVTDNGEGIPIEFLPYVFDRFRQANSSSTRQHGGLGLGLAIVRHLTEMHGGTVTAESQGAGQGAIFTVKLPLKSAEAMSGEVEDETPLETQSVVEAVSETSSLNGVKILIVEDGADTREILQAILNRTGAKVEAVASVKEAMSVIEGAVPDIIVSDIGMPEEDGFALMQRLKVWELEHSVKIPVIALTAYASEQDRIRSLSAGFAVHLTKPIEPTLLVSTLAEVLNSPR